MRTAFDTSVFIAALVQDHPRHDVAMAWLQTRKRMQRLASCHALAETWSVLTRHPLDVPVSPEVARAIVKSTAP